MAELEKVIKGLEICIRVQNNEKCPDECPYRKDICYGTVGLMADALSLLKAQEARVMSEEELRQYLMINESGPLHHDQWQELGQRAPLYIEFRRPDEYQVNWRTAERLRPWAMESMFWDSYNKDRRCWTSRPTDWRRAATPWAEPPKEG